MKEIVYLQSSMQIKGKGSMRTFFVNGEHHGAPSESIRCFIPVRGSFMMRTAREPIMM